MCSVISAALRIIRRVVELLWIVEKEVADRIAHATGPPAGGTSCGC